MKIAFIGGRDIHTLGGIEAYMFNLTRELAALGHEPVVYCESDHDSSTYENGVKIITWVSPSSRFLCKPLLAFKSTWHAIRKEKVDFIHYNAWPPSLASVLASLYGVPSCMEGHGLEWQRTKYSGFERKIMKMMERFTARLNSNLVMCSEDQVEYFRKEYGRDSVCIHGAVNLPEDGHESSSDILDRYCLAPGKFFLFMGRLVQDKNPDYLIRAYRASAHGDFKLVIAGDNPAMPDYVAGLHKLAAADKDVVFTGAVYGDDKRKLLENAYCFCIPSTIEGLSIVMLEASSFRLPTIASNIQANREFLGDDAVYVEVEDVESLQNALVFAIGNPSILDCYAARNYDKVVAGYTWQQVALKYDSYLKEIVKKA